MNNLDSMLQSISSFLMTIFRFTTMTSKRSVIAGEVATVPIVNMIYYNNIKSVELYSKSLFIVLVKDNADYPKVHIYTREKAKGTAFIDALTNSCF